MSSLYSIAALIVIALVTAALRFAPFLLFSGKETPRWLSYLGDVLPYAIMGMLVVFCCRDISFARAGDFLPELLAGAVVVGSYVRKRSTLLSIVAGTVCYMLLVQLVFI